MSTSPHSQNSITRSPSPRERVNTRPFQKLAGSRRSVFEATERAALRPLPATRYELADWRTAKVNIDYHIAVDLQLYSVPYTLVGATVDVRLTTATGRDPS